jgi:hypothetical protein
VISDCRRCPAHPARSKRLAPRWGLPRILELQALAWPALTWRRCHSQGSKFQRSAWFPPMSSSMAMHSSSPLDTHCRPATAQVRWRRSSEHSARIAERRKLPLRSPGKYRASAAGRGHAARLRPLRRRRRNEHVGKHKAWTSTSSTHNDWPSPTPATGCTGTQKTRHRGP